jgi:tripartite-type tricarboxylate transporter receptor subunit TctC
MTRAGTKSLLSAVLVMLAVAGGRGEAQPYPSGPVKVISDSAPGSAPDAILRIVAERLSDAWGQQVVVMNQPGASVHWPRAPLPAHRPTATRCSCRFLPRS